ncbi:MAG: LPS export ABC transporter periplasmic protein LptC [Giesbergeria sp.]|uniref:LPS export ABC transporter periplasmic protein LptC n=1 Tax=Giesbergeria sp. TaxID=2818473 RepID=UPI0026046F5E|nr:LPS export ABC transporter periplasmic protein LptC [Giesbergeria sp.]MDD2610050.1 LPS export ABC transporter periplasmic protein LptC [Giesbergeria sp.]
MSVALHRRWDSVSMYLPVLLMGLLALGTWWLVRNAPQATKPAQAAVASSNPDYFMRQFAVQRFDTSGRLESEVRGEMARHYPANDTLEIDQVRIQARSTQGQQTQARANRALSNSDGTEIQLFGDAHITRQASPTAAAQPTLEFRGEFLHLWPQTERVRSHLPVRLTRGQDQFTADTMEYDHSQQVLQLQGRVRGTLMPPRR